MRWLTLAAEAGDTVGQRNLATLYFKGELVALDATAAARWYRAASEQGDAESQDMLSWLLVEGELLPPDYEEARRWALAAAEQGVATAMTRLGMLYHNALGVERDPTAAATWWRKAADLGDVDGAGDAGRRASHGRRRRARRGAGAHLADARAARRQQPGRAVPAGDACRLHARAAAPKPSSARIAAFAEAAAMIVGTAGHIDHGKTDAGAGADRRRHRPPAGGEGARHHHRPRLRLSWPRPDGEIIGFVDVPGHERLVHNMLAGATGIDFVLLVVAADDGVMPQTREHLAILDLLGLAAASSR